MSLLLAKNREKEQAVHQAGTRVFRSDRVAHLAIYLLLAIDISLFADTSYATSPLVPTRNETALIPKDRLSPAPFILFPAVTGTPWIQQIIESQSNDQAWINISSDYLEPIGIIDVTVIEHVMNSTGTKETDSFFPVSIIDSSVASESLEIMTPGSEQILPSFVQQISGLFEDKTGGQCECCSTQNRKSLNASCKICQHCEKRGCQSLSNEELAPAQRLWLKAWKSPIGNDPWITVFQMERSTSTTLFCDANYDNTRSKSQSLRNGLGSNLLSEDLPVTQVDLNIKPKSGRMPQQRSRASNSSESERHLSDTGRNWGDCLVHWNASEASHGPLYFEEVNLERHGYSRGYLQPFVSGFQFFSKVPLLPGLMSVDRPFSLQYELGESRAGSYAPYQNRKTPWTVRALLVEIGVVTGVSFIIP